MSDITPFLKSLISVAGVSGFEAPVGKLIKEKWTPLVDEVSESKLGYAGIMTCLSNGRRCMNHAG